MKAAVLNELDSVPVYIDFFDPVPQDETQIVMNVKAAALKNLDKVKTKEFYYAHYSELPEMHAFAAADKLTIETESMNLKDISMA
ncbi:MAG: hypothetical protein WCR12_04470 [Dysgonamonadaceae bacterium]